jgi:hypothetical protein
MVLGLKRRKIMTEFNVDELRERLDNELEKTAERMIETKKMLSDAYGSSGLYFGPYTIDSVQSLQDQYVYLRVRCRVLTDIYESLFGEEYVRKEEKS